MNKIAFYFYFLVSPFLLALTGCPFGCDTGREDVVLENTEATITPNKEVYSVGEIIQISVSSIADFSKYGKYEFKITADELDKTLTTYIPSESIIFLDGDNELQQSKISFEYVKDEEENVNLKKNISIKFLKQGIFDCYAYVHAFVFYEGGGFGSDGFLAGWRITVSE